MSIQVYITEPDEGRYVAVVEGIESDILITFGQFHTLDAMFVWTKKVLELPNLESMTDTELDMNVPPDDYDQAHMH